MSIYDLFSGGNRPFDKEEWAAAKQAQRKEAYELIDNTCFEMMASGDSFRQYLDVQGRFDRYSVANAILVSAQMPEATQLKEYSKWKASRVYVNKDAQKIIILEPSKEYTREDGTKGISYNAKVVYDISETSAKDRQQEQEPKSMRELVSALIDASPVPCVPVDELELPAYYDSSQQTIFVKKGLSEEVLFVSMAKEVSAAVYDFKYNESRDVSDFNSFCVAYISAEVENPIDMERIKLALQGYNFGNGYISWAKTNYGGYSYANAVEFSTMQAQRLGWEKYGDTQYPAHVLRYYPYGRAFTSGSNQAIVEVALTQLGNEGGQPYWSWYGFDGRVEWCACFVSWCADQCGYIESGIIPKFAGCVDGSNWFKGNGQWQDRNYEPQAGDIIFFDWEGDGETDHVGIVEKCENGVVYTVEGNSGDACRQKQYTVGSSSIYGYGVPAY